MKYTVVVPIEAATGERHYDVEAESPEEAKRLVNTGDVECQSEEIQVDRVADLCDWEVREG